MTNLTDKLKKVIAIGAITVGSILGINSNEAYAQAVDNGGNQKKGEFKQETIFNAYDIGTHLRKLPDESEKKTDQELIRVYPGVAAITSNEKDKTNPEVNKLIPILSYKIVDHSEFNAIEYKPTEKEKKLYDDFLKEKGETGNTTKFSPDEEKRLFHTLHEKNTETAYDYFPISLKADTTHLDSAWGKGKNLGILIPSDGNTIMYRKFSPDREEIYVIGHPGGLKFIEFDENGTKVGSEEFNEYKERLDSLNRDFLSSTKVRQNYEDENLFNGKVLDLLNLPYLEKEEKEEDKQKEKSGSLELKVGLNAGKYTGKGSFVEASAEIQIKENEKGDKSYLGFYGRSNNEVSKILSEGELNTGWENPRSLPTGTIVERDETTTYSNKITLDEEIGLKYEYENEKGWGLCTDLAIVKESLEEKVSVDATETKTRPNGDVEVTKVKTEELYNDKKWAPTVNFEVAVDPVKIIKQDSKYTDVFKIKAALKGVISQVEPPYTPVGEDDKIKGKGAYVMPYFGASVDLIKLFKNLFSKKE